MKIKNENRQSAFPEPLIKLHKRFTVTRYISDLQRFIVCAINRVLNVFEVFRSDIRAPSITFFAIYCKWNKNSIEKTFVDNKRRKSE